MVAVPGAVQASIVLSAHAHTIADLDILHLGAGADDPADDLVADADGVVTGTLILSALLFITLPQQMFSLPIHCAMYECQSHKHRCA